MNPTPWGHFNAANGHLPGNTTGAQPSNARQGRQQIQWNSAPNNHNAVAANNSDLLFDASSPRNPPQPLFPTSNATQHSKKRQRRVNGQAGNAALPIQSSMIVPSSHDAGGQAYYRQQLYEMQIANVEEQKSRLLQEMNALVMDVGTNDNINLSEVTLPVYEYAEWCAEKAKIETAYKKGAELEQKKGKKGMQNYINAVASKERKAALIFPHTYVLQLLITGNKKLHSENRRLRQQTGSSSSTGQPPDDPPSGGSPPEDFGQDDTASDGSNLRGPGSIFRNSSGGPAFHGGSSSGDQPPVESMPNTQFPSQELPAAEESDGSRTCSKLIPGSEHATPKQPVIMSNAQEPGGNGKLDNCSTLVNRTLESNNRPSGSNGKVGSLPANRAKPMLPLPLSLPVSVYQVAHVASSFDRTTDRHLIRRPRNRHRGRQLGQAATTINKSFSDMHWRG